MVVPTKGGGVAGHNIFIAHRHEDDQLVGDLKTMLAATGSQIRDSSITTENPNQAHNEEYIRSLIRDRIEWAGKVIVIVSPETHQHEWVDWEIEYAKKFPDKKVIGVWAPGTTTENLPEELEDYADSMINWDAAAIIDALENEKWTGPDGGPAEPHSIPRAPC